MKTNYRPKNRETGANTKRVAVVCIIFIVLAVIFSFADGLALRIFSPLWKGERALSNGFESVLGYFRTKSSLVEENKNLKAALFSEETVLKENRADLSSRDEVLASLGRVPLGTGTAASVLVHPPETPYDVLVVDAGSDQGVTIGRKVFLPEGPEIGIVSEVFARNSRVKLYSSKDEKTDAILERNNVPISLVGQGGGSFEFDLPRDLGVEVGDKILSTGLTSVLVGIVRSIQVTPTDSFKRVLVGAVENIYSLRFVVISS